MADVAKIIIIAITDQGVAYQEMTGEAFLEIKQDWASEPDEWNILGIATHPPRRDFHMGVYNVEGMRGRLYDYNEMPEQSTPIYDQLKLEMFEREV